MSWWVSLQKKGKTCIVPMFSAGGTYAVGGDSEADLNITWNYGRHYAKALHPEGIRWLNGKKARRTIKRLEKAVNELGTVQDRDYWKATPGNAGYALSILLAWARLHPGARFEVH